MAAGTVTDRDNETIATRGRRSGQPGHEATTTRERRPGGPGRGGSGPLERITVNLVNRASQALQLVVKITGDSRTDSINRAIQVYAYVVEIDSKGGAIYVRESENAELQRLKIF